MTLIATTHVNFRGEAREALAFYQRVFGGQMLAVSYGDLVSMGGRLADDVAEDEHDLLSFGQVTAESGFSVMAYDVPAARPFDRGENAFFLSLHCTTREEVEQVWAALAAEARGVRDPLGPAAFSPLYGMLTDRYGVTWVIDLLVEHAG